MPWQRVVTRHPEHVRCELAERYGPRRFVYVYTFPEGDANATTSKGYVRRCANTADAIAYLERTENLKLES